MRELLDAIDTLTKPVRRKVIQDAEGDTTTKTVTVILPSLLEQLDQAILGAVGIGGSGALASERNALDFGALEKLREIRDKVNGWARMANVPPRDDAGETLRAWFVAFNLRATSPEVATVYVREMRAWAAQIEAKLDPPRISDLPDACPVCDASEWWNADTKERYYRPLVVQYRGEGAEMVDNAKGLCRACGQVWSARELAFELERKQHAGNGGEMRSSMA